MAIAHSHNQSSRTAFIIKRVAPIIKWVAPLIQIVGYTKTALGLTP